MRTVTLTRATREEVLPFSILGGKERGYGIFVTKVQQGSKAADAGLKRGDQVKTKFDLCILSTGNRTWSYYIYLNNLNQDFHNDKSIEIKSV